MVGSLVAASVFGLTAGTVAYAAAVFAVNFALSSIVTRMFADNPEGQQDMGVRQQVPPSGVNAIPIVYGDAYMGGTFVDAVLANEQRKMYYVLAISSISPNGQFEFDQTDMYYGDRLIGFDPTEQGKVITLTDEAGNVDTKISGNLFIYLFTSDQAGTITPINSSGTLPSGIMGGADIAAAQRWPATGRQMNGLAFAIVVLNYNRDADTTQLSPVTFHVSHTLNGTGVAKAGDVWYDYITNPVYGGAVDAAFVNSSSATALNTYGDQLITFTDSDGNPSTQPRYRINGVLDAGQTVLSNIDRIVSACDSWMTYNAALGQWSVVINKAESAAYAFDDDNIVGEIRVSATDITSSINQVEARFPFKENRDQAAFVNIETPTGLLYPNEPVNKYSITYDLVNDSVQAHYLANRLLEQAREDLIVSFSTTYYGIQVDAGNVVSVTNSDYGWNNKLFRVMKVNEASLPDGSLGAKLELSEYNAQVYDDKDITQFTPVPNSDLASPVYFSALTAPVVIASRPSDAVPSFDIQVTVPTTGRVTFGTLYYTTNPSNPLGWKVLNTVTSPNNTPVTNGISYTFANQILPAGTFYFTYTVGNEIASSQKSSNSAAFVWSPTGATGPAGENGLTAITAYKVQDQADPTPTFSATTTGATAPTGWTLTTPAVAVGEVLWYIQGQYNSNAVTVDGVAANTTAWTGPIAASVFQDIRSDNWDGANPPVYGSSATYGTEGYYIERNTGNVFFNNGIFRGNIIGGSNIEITGSAKFNGAITTTVGTAAVTANTLTAQKYGIIAFADNTDYNPVIETAAVFGRGDNNAFGVRGESSGSGGTGVFGSGPYGGVEGNASATNGVGVRGYGNGSAGVGVFGLSNGSGAGVYGISNTGPAVWCNGPFKWSTYTFAVPTGTVTDVLRGNGTWGPFTVSYANNLGTSGSSYSTVLSGGVLTLQSTNNTCSISNSSGLGVYFTSNVGPTFSPLGDNTTALGYTGARWSVVYAATGTINTSDENQKQDIESLSIAELAVARRIKSLIKKFRFKDAVEAKGNDARIHVGVIAQDVKDAFTAEGLDATRYGIFCSDTDEDGVITLGVRYEELLAFVIAAM